MTRLWTSTQESGSLATEGLTTFDGTAGLTTISTTNPLIGTRSLRIQPTTTGQGSRYQKVFIGANTLNKLFGRYYIRFAAAPPTPGAELVTVLNSALTEFFVIELAAARTLRMETSGGGLFTGTAVLATDTLYRIEFSIDAAAAANDDFAVRLYAGHSTNLIEEVTLNFAWTTTGPNTFMVGAYSGSAYGYKGAWDVYYDDFAINDDQGTFDNSWVGPSIWASGAAVSATSGNVTASYPTDVTADDILVCEVTALDNVTCTFPAGWVKKAENNNGTGLRQTIAWKRYDPTWLILDDFERSAGAIGSDWTTPWDGDSGTMAVATGGVAKPGAGTTAVALWAPTVFATDQQTYVVLGAITDTVSVSQLFLRGTPSTYSPDGSGLTTCFMLRFAQGTGAFSFRKKIAGASSVSLGTFTQAFSAGDAIGFRAVGTALTAWRKVPGGAWTQIGSVTDSSVTGTGQIGFSLVDPNTADSFGGGAVADTETSALVTHTAGGKILARVHRARGRITTGDPFETSAVSTPAAAATGTFPTVTSLTANAEMMYAMSYAEDFTVGPSITNAQGLNLTELGEDEIA